jgi:PAS domain S-box-containing protein
MPSSHSSEYRSWRASGRATEPGADRANAWNTYRSPWVRYGLALLLAIAAIAVRAWLDPYLGGESIAIFLAAILAGAWFGGVGPALFTLVVLHIVHGYWYSTPTAPWELNIAAFVTTAAWYVVGITAGVLSQMRTAAQRRAHDKHLEAASQREHLHTTLSCMADGVLVTGVDGRVTLLNRAAEALTGWSLADAQGKAWQEVFCIRGEESPEEIESALDRVLHEGRVVHEQARVVLVSRAGCAIPIAFSAAPVQALNEQVTGAVLIFRDESQRRRAELALQDADRRKDEFLATLAHELRNPLAPICMGLELLGMHPENAQAAAEVRSMMQRQTQHMVRLIDDLLDVSRITRGKLELRRAPVELADVVRDAVAATRPLLDESEHQLTVRLPDKPLVLNADANRLTQVLTNLLNNAAKYTPRAGRIDVTAESRDGEAIISVADTGIGIPADKLESVFDMFTQVHDSGGRGRTGLGIGLTLARRLVELHGGRLEVHSRGRDLGTTFVVRLPALAEAPANLREPPENRPLPTNTVRRRVLIVDDNPDALESLSRAVALLGHEVRRARDGLEALEVGRLLRPDLVLMDLGMPNVDGYEAARRMRQEAWGRKLMLVATTGWGQTDDRRRTASAGFDRHLVKPVSLAMLREVLEPSTPPLAVDPLHEPSAALT